MEKLHGLEHAALTRTCSIDMKLQHRHEQAAWTWTGSMDMNREHGHEQGAWIRSYSKDIDIQHKHDHATQTWLAVWTWMQFGNRHTVCTWTCTMDKYAEFQVQVHAATPCPCCMFIYGPLGRPKVKDVRIRIHNTGQKKMVSGTNIAPYSWPEEMVELDPVWTSSVGGVAVQVEYNSPDTIP
jgi:hypothetical protein